MTPTSTYRTGSGFDYSARCPAIQPISIPSALTARSTSSCPSYCIPDYHSSRCRKIVLDAFKAPCMRQISMAVPMPYQPPIFACVTLRHLLSTGARYFPIRLSWTMYTVVLLPFVAARCRSRSQSTSSFRDFGADGCAIQHPPSEYEDKAGISIQPPRSRLWTHGQIYARPTLDVHIHRFP